MAIRDRLRRILRRSNSSGALSQADSNTTTTATATADASETSSLHNVTTATSAFSKVLSTTFGSRDKDADRDRIRDKEKTSTGSRSKGRSRSGKKAIHPSQRPLTLQNLKHQEMLSQFTMTFGASDPSQIESLSFCGVSPCCTRPSSVDLDRGDMGSLIALSVAAMSAIDNAHRP